VIKARTGVVVPSRVPGTRIENWYLNQPAGKYTGPASEERKRYERLKAHRAIALPMQKGVAVYGD
jgi:hypothetical protein